MLTLVCIENGFLVVHAVAWEDLAAEVKPEHVFTVALGSVLTISLRYHAGLLFSF